MVSCLNTIFLSDNVDQLNKNANNVFKLKDSILRRELLFLMC